MSLLWENLFLFLVWPFHSLPDIYNHISLNDLWYLKHEFAQANLWNFFPKIFKGFIDFVDILLPAQTWSCRNIFSMFYLSIIYYLLSITLSLDQGSVFLYLPVNNYIPVQFFVDCFINSVLVNKPFMIFREFTRGKHWKITGTNFCLTSQWIKIAFTTPFPTNARLQSNPWVRFSLINITDLKGLNVI